VVRDKLDNRIYKPDQLRDHGIKEIGVIPNIEPLIKEDYQGRLFLEQDGHRFATSLVTLVNPIAAATEAYRHVRTNIQFNHPETDIQTLLVASPGIMEGKSTTAANLAIVMAQAGRRTLLIDADLRRPRQHRIFGLKREAGLVEVLANGTDFDPEAWKIYVDNLYVLTAGRTYSPTNVAVQGEEDEEGRVGLIANPAELLGSEQMHQVLDTLREMFDMIIIDTPPVLAATDAALLSTQCDAAIVVARAGKTKDGELEFALESFNDVGANVLGVLLNAFDINMAYGLKYRYQHYTRYGRYSKYGYYGYRPNQ
jgi:Mrp family chromosome partitioning ATPase